MLGYQYITEIWAKNKRDSSIIMHPRSRLDGMFMVSLDGKSNNYKPYTKEQILHLVKSTAFTVHSCIRMASPTINCKENGNGYLPQGFDREYDTFSTPRHPAKIAAIDIDDESFIDSGIDERILTAIKTRRGQTKFRTALLSLYENACQVTGSKVPNILEAAHIFPHDKATNYRVFNGLLLRSDIHTLFDLNLIKLDENTKITIDASLLGTEYEKYDGKVLLSSVPDEMQSNLIRRLELFAEM